MGNDEQNEEKRIKRINELFPGSNKFVIYDDIEKIRKAICKIKAGDFGTGFFVDYNSSKYLLTNYHVISKETKKIEIEIWDKSHIILDLNKRYLIYLPQEEKDITIILLKNNEFEKIEYLYFDLNYIIGYNQYKNNDVLGAGYPYGNKLATGGGIIKEILNECEFYHTIPTAHGSSGSPIILYNTLKVIGIHKQGDKNEKLNLGTFIGEAIKAINNKKFSHLDIINKNPKVQIKPINDIKKLYNIDNNSINTDTIKNYFKIDNTKKIKKRKASVDLDIKYDIIKDYKYKNEINCVYIVEKNKEVNLLYDFTGEVSANEPEITKQLYKEAKNEINSENIDIYINNRKIIFNPKYKSNETGLIKVK